MPWSRCGNLCPLLNDGSLKQVIVLILKGMDGFAPIPNVKQHTFLNILHLVHPQQKQEVFLVEHMRLLLIFVEVNKLPILMTGFSRSPKWTWVHHLKKKHF